ncbi:MULTISPECIES: phenylalanine--tRNA ligase subunit beta [Bacillus]|jgi:phenylalanyl-tRNA synthetase beta chain|uniref:Phenylalanine--tRNA ligase beta subunit n=1 Tax=Bacillus amyloliquefaciens (strain ATCC 23350 / DSM 7 / BCRC 11601 / CCUG 28519 / NBRC 15535 / NRRL B-14393 / F) TaxID=692420 RepID=A0A9P1NIU9_BACAS|nr:MULTISPECIES: phenylalanine--tRNA ligase subunit beta [Bacillus amyloliquefaciens group]AIW34673.1 phenylalanyl-tRNA synthase subunit beta [Bacillus subtilis]AEB24975.1 phenylalanyl-tRNA synthetase subunit beta [Bacillus amyloliquefaciens TA208]AEB64483.1 phenylalanyl-tRNA synthetase (beta subunit) [Bacillus amyloliquefaciens LL3]AEK90005.1 phenylalanyl-tRNA synthetase subunit beta [Bacillus amyloliquefaciens XH7]ARW39992.1 Phenylalanine--tRNA ligase [Bacillus amyloliquefaciens]
MFVSYKWLEDYVDLQGIDPAVLAEKITRAGIEVEGIEYKGEGVKGVVIGHVLEREQHPNADKLNKCLVDIGAEEPVQIICGAPNVDKGQKVAVATVGAVLPGNFKIKKAKLRGEASHGMICSLQELGIESKLVAKEYAEGIFVFPNDAETGADAMAALQLDDAILELGLTPNRADAMNMLGVAYEVAAILGAEVKLPETSYETAAEKAADAVSVKIEDTQANPHYAAKIIKNVKIGPSPLWMQTKLMNAGIRPHNNVVDITNFVLLEYGQPLHAFDYDRFGSKEVVVRKAAENETIVTLDEQERKLSSSHLVITNGKKAQAVAGVMGGAESEVREDTTSILLEAAYFDGQTVRKASRDLGLRSEASARYEKGIDPARVLLAAERACSLIQAYAGGEVLSGTVEENHLKIEANNIHVSVEKVNAVLGMTIAKEEIISIYKRLGFAVGEAEDVLVVTVPSRRGDIKIEEDLIEEAARLYGYDNIPSTLPETAGTTGGLTPYQAKRRKVRRFLEGAGLSQATTYSLTNDKKAAAFAIEKSFNTMLALPMSEERSILRHSLVPNLLEAVSYNLARQTDSVALYETGSVFLTKEENTKPVEKERVAGAVTGLWRKNLWQGEKKPVDFFVVKGIVEGLLHQLNVSDRIEFVQSERKNMHPGRTANILLNGSLAGFIGQVHPAMEKELDIKETYVFELDLHALLTEETEPLVYTAIPKYPSVTRDIALVADKTVTSGQLEAVIKDAGGALLKEVTVFDVYEGEHMEEGKKSVAFSLQYVNPEQTLTEEEVTKVHENVLKALEETYQAVLRG